MRRRRDTYNPWSIVNLVFHHLADEGLHPTLGDSGDPGAPAAALLRALGIQPAAEGNRAGLAATSGTTSPRSGRPCSASPEGASGRPVVSC